MNITLISAGSRGDIAPFAVLGAALQAQGHDATLLAHDEFIGLAHRSGVRFVPARGQNPRELLDSPAGRKLLENAKSPRGYAREFRKLVEPVIPTAFEDSAEAAEGADLVLYSPLAFGAFNAAEYLRIPSMQVQLQPVLPSRRYPSVFTAARTLGPIGNWITHVMGERVLSDAIREPLNRARRELWGLEPRAARNLLADQRQREPLPLLAFDELLVPAAPGWPDGLRPTGALLEAASEVDRLPAEVEAFLAQGDDVVYFGLGSMIVEHPERLMEALTAALAKLGVRGIVQRGWGGLAPQQADPRLLFIDEVNHDLLFPRAAAIVHHAGAGTTARALRSGRPSLPLPLMGDQFFWGYRSVEAGISATSLKQSKVSTRTLCDALDRTLHEPAVTATAGRLAQQLAGDSPAERAATVIALRQSSATRSA